MNYVQRSRNRSSKREHSFSSISSDSIDNIQTSYSKSRKVEEHRNNRDKNYTSEDHKLREKSLGSEGDRSRLIDSRGERNRSRLRESTIKTCKEEDSFRRYQDSIKENSEKSEVQQDIDMLDPSICDFSSIYIPEIEADQCNVKDVKLCPGEDINRLDRLEKLVDVLVDNAVKTHSETLSQEVNTSSNLNGELIPRNKSFTTSMWINKIDEECIQRNLDEKSCIKYMQAKMTGTMKAWFKNILSYDITWPELKMLVIRTFPDNTDFAHTLKLLVEKYKKPDETITQYYFSKMYLLEACKITGADAVSCLIDGLESPELRQGARIYNFLTPEALYSEYFLKLADLEFRQSQEFLEITRYIASENIETGKIKNYNFEIQNIEHKSHSRKKCFTCRKVGHIAADCRHAPICYNCNFKGHIASKCPLKTGN